MPRWLTQPALFITGTDTGVGKTAVTCAIAGSLVRRGLRVGVCKPIATGCRLIDGHWVSDDALALRRHADVELPLTEIQPVGYEPPVAPAVAAAMSGKPVRLSSIRAALRRIERQCDIVLIEGVGGIAVPIGAKRTVLDLADAIGVPLVVVARHNLGTLNHTALTCAAIRQAGLPLAGLIINGMRDDSTDASIADNPQWLATQNRTRVLATVPHARSVAPHRRRLPQPIIDAVDHVNWQELAR